MSNNTSSIVSKVLSFCNPPCVVGGYDELEETITNNLKQTETLKQSILKRAFEGKLV